MTILSPLAAKLLPPELCSRWELLVMGGGELPALRGSSEAERALAFVEACWWARPKALVDVEDLLATPDWAGLIGPAVIEQFVYEDHPDLAEIIRLLSESGHPSARAAVRYARAFRALQFTLPQEAEEHVLAALELAGDHADAWFRMTLLGAMASIAGALRRMSRCAELQEEARGVVTGEPMNGVLDVLALSWAEKPPSFETLRRLRSGFARHGPLLHRCRTHTLLAIGLVVQGDGLEAAEEELEALLRDPASVVAQRHLPRVMLACLAMKRGHVERARGFLQGGEVPLLLRYRAARALVLAWIAASDGKTEEEIWPLIYAAEVQSRGKRLGHYLQPAVEAVGRMVPGLKVRLAAIAMRLGWRELGPCEGPVPVDVWDLSGVRVRGGQGALWDAFNRASGEAVLVKWFPPGAPQPLRQEVRSLAGLNHPHVLAVEDWLRADAVVEAISGGRLQAGSVGLVLPLAAGSLVDHPPQQHQVRPVLLGVLDALEHAHAQGVLHLDLKPANLLTGDPSCEDMEVMLTDFAASAGGWGTESAQLAGTRGFMAPEQAHVRRAQLGPWTDLFAVGCMVLQWTDDPAWRAWAAALTQPHPMDRPRNVATARASMPSTPPDRLGAPLNTVSTFPLTGDLPGPEDSLAYAGGRGELAPMAPRQRSWSRSSGWMGLLNWRTPAWLERPAFAKVWSSLALAHQGTCQVVGVAGAAHGRTRLFDEVAARAHLEGASSQRAWLSSEDDLGRVLRRLAGAVGHLAPEDPGDLAGWARRSEGWERTGVLAISGGGSARGMEELARRVHGRPGRILVVYEAASGLVLPPWNVQELSELALRIAGVAPSEAAELAADRAGSPGWMALTLEVLQRRGQLEGPLGARTIRGQWPATLQRTLLGLLEHRGGDGHALRAVRALSDGEAPSESGLEVLLDEGLARQFESGPRLVDGWLGDSLMASHGGV